MDDNVEEEEEFDWRWRQNNNKENKVDNSSDKKESFIKEDINLNKWYTNKIIIKKEKRRYKEAFGESNDLKTFLEKLKYWNCS